MDRTQVFLVRVWLNRGFFRASVRAASDEVPRQFFEAGELAAFLSQAAAEAAATSIGGHLEDRTQR